MICQLRVMALNLLQEPTSAALSACCSPGTFAAPPSHRHPVSRGCGSAKRFGTEGNDPLRSRASAARGNKARKRVGKFFAEMRHFSLERNRQHGQELNRRKRRKQRVGLSCPPSAVAAREDGPLSPNFGLFNSSSVCSRKSFRPCHTFDPLSRFRWDWPLDRSSRPWSPRRGDPTFPGLLTVTCYIKRLHRTVFQEG
jgi:hypothetical protein